MGLLNFMPKNDTPEGQGLLAAAFSLMSAKGSGWNAAGDAGRQYMGVRNNAQQTASQNELQRLQMDSYKRKAMQEQQQAQESARIRDLMAGGSTDYQALIRQGVPFEQVKALADSRNFGRDKVARTAEIEGPNGSKVIQGYNEFGDVQGPSANGYVAPVSVNQGNQTSFVKPMAGLSLPMGMSPADRDQSARGWAGVNQSAARLAFDKAGGADGVGQGSALKQFGKAPAGYRFLPDGSMEAIPGGPADVKAGQTGVQKATDAREALAVIDEAEKLIPLSTGSGIGSMVDSSAGFFGFSPKGAQAGARLKALEGMLVSKMPKMSGPQSDKDVLLYKQMAGQVGDTSLPVASRMAALETIKGIQTRYGGSGMPTKVTTGGWSIEKAD